MKYLLILITFILIGCEQKPASPEETKFKNASLQILTSKDGFYYGDTKEEKELAKKFSMSMKSLQKKFFTGGKSNRGFSLTKEEFLTYCRINEKSIVFLVHVPQFKRYKGEVRDTLNELSWYVANEVTKDIKNEVEGLELVIALKGSIAYGGASIGKRGGTPKSQNSFIIDDEQFIKYFK